MVDLATSFAAGFLATFVPLYLGLFTPRILVRVWKNPKLPIFLAAASAGIIFWFFLDVMGDAVTLDVNQGFSRAFTPGARLTQAILIILFALSLGILFGLEKKFSSKNPGPSLEPAIEPGPAVSSKFMGITFAIAALAALGIGFHALGEGMDIGASIPSQPTILDAIGGILAGVAYVLHKFLEGLVIGVFALLSASTSARKLGVLGVLSGVPTLIGFFLGAFIPIPEMVDFYPLNITFFFALGSAASLYIETKLVPLFTRTRMEYASVIPLLLGFYAMYIAGLFHG